MITLRGAFTFTANIRTPVAFQLVHHIVYLESDEFVLLATPWFTVEILVKVRITIWSPLHLTKVKPTQHKLLR